MHLLILTIQLREDRDFDGAGCWKNAITVMQKNPPIGQVENGDAYHPLKLVGDVADAGIDLFPQQIAAGVGTSRFVFLLVKNIRRKHKGNRRSKPHWQSRARFWSVATCGSTARAQIPARETRIHLSVWEN